MLQAALWTQPAQSGLKITVNLIITARHMRGNLL